MFFKCSKCQNVWQYPIEKCPHCFVALKRVPSEKIKVRNICKVSIPTVLHPLVPYSVFLLEDDKGNKWVQKTVKDEFKLQQDREAVAIWRVKYDVLEAIEKVFYLLEVKKLKGLKVLVLPALNSPKHPHLRENTSPEVLDALIKYLASQKVKEIKVVGQSFDEIPIGASAQKSQLLSVCSENGIKPLDLAEGKFIKKDDFEISEEVFNSDLIINLPILGSESSTSNLTRFIKKESYLSLEYLHKKEEIIKKLLELLPDHLTIADGIVVQKSNKQTAYLGLILASFNSLDLDKVFNQIIMREEIGKIPVVGREIKELQFNLDKIS